ncbi:histidinol dehydrogenase [Gammaproteobacteria bacterium]|nr:MAG: histidinol dehydrogenase [Gammaproteobacteria bacterium]CAG0945031.1 histidinol dehydrogenase [Gammaproteobacteria bacterium]
MSTGSLLTRVDWSVLDEAGRRSLLERPAVRGGTGLPAAVADIIGEVRSQGDAALLRLTAKLDGVTLRELAVSDAEAAATQRELDPAAIRAIDVAIRNVRAFHAAQQSQPVRVETVPGVVCERVVRPLRAVGLYVPAGRAPLPSTAIMLGVPAALAGCPIRVLCTPPRPDGRADPAVVVAARACGVQQIFKVGGAQAVAAMAYGTATVPKVDKIFGPGNAWVTAAKQAVALDPAGAALDMPAGPSEVMVVADAGANPRFVALDLLSQAEHGPDSQVLLVTTASDMVDRVRAEIDAALPGLSRRDIMAESLLHGAAIVVASLAEAVDVANRYAPEHLILQVAEPRRWIDGIWSAGSVFLGPWTPESVGDYCSGTNHVLPTYGHARAYSGLSVTDFQRHMTLQEASAAGLAALAPTVETLASLEGLEAHAAAVRVRTGGGVSRP